LCWQCVLHFQNTLALTNILCALLLYLLFPFIHAWSSTKREVEWTAGRSQFN
jgi:hypothetical protein